MQRVLQTEIQERKPAAFRLQTSNAALGKSLFAGMLVLFSVFMLARPAAAAADKVGTASQHVSTIMKNLKKMYAGGRDYSGITTEKGVQAGVFPKEMVEQSTGVVSNVWGGQVKLLYSDKFDMYVLGFWGVPHDACARLVHAAPVPVSNVAINLNRLSDSETDKEIASECNRDGAGSGQGNIILWGAK